jgi:hypothetical protein
MESCFLMSFDVTRGSNQDLLGDSIIIGRVFDRVMLGYVNIRSISYVPSEHVIPME